MTSVNCHPPANYGYCTVTPYYLHSTFCGFCHAVRERKRKRAESQRAEARLKDLGLRGSKTEDSWSWNDRIHACCGSRVARRHCIGCPRSLSDGTLPVDTSG